jgi:alpha-1,3-rhamnosyl/mannosyltransferase
VLGLPPERVTTVHCGIDPAFRPQLPEEIAAVRERLNLPPRYLLYVGTIEPRKNLGMLLRAFCDLRGEHREGCPLVLGGTWGWKSQEEQDFFENEARYRGVRSLGYVGDDDLPGLYAGAEALLYPSYYEGFGLPPVEMMACGGAAIVSTADAVREVVGSAALMLNPDDLPAWRDAMKQVITNRDFLAPYRRKGAAQAAKFNWDNAARATHAVYQSVLGLAGPTLSHSSIRAAA